MKTVGIIGGLGPETTTKFYMDLVFACSNKAKQRPNILISNVAIPLVVERDLIKESKNQDKVLPFLIKSARQLEKGGADFIAIPCNTVHIFIKEVRKSVKIPVLSIIEESSKFLKDNDINEVGLFATAATINNKLFDGKLLNNGINIKIPNSNEQIKLNQIIYNLVNNKHLKHDEKTFEDILNSTNVKSALLACTDLQLLNINLKKSKYLIL